MSNCHEEEDGEGSLPPWGGGFRLLPHFTSPTFSALLPSGKTASFATSDTCCVMNYLPTRYR